MWHSAESFMTQKVNESDGVQRNIASDAWVAMLGKSTQAV